MTFPVLSANGPSGYKLTRSLRFRSSASAYLNRTPATATNQKTWTWSAWVKRGTLSGFQSELFVVRDSINFPAFIIDYQNTDTIAVLQLTTGAAIQFKLETTAVYRDISSWYHIVVAFDTTQATSSNRIKIYVNGTQITAFGTATYPSLNFNTNVNTTVSHFIGAQAVAGQYNNGYMAEINFVDGQALTPSSFGSTNATTGVWQPAKYTGTYGTNGFYLPFTDNSALTTASNAGLGKDFSGNANYWVTNNISITAGATYDSMTDVPTLTSSTAANFAVMNPLWQGRTNAPTNGNLDYPASSIGIGTMDVSQFSSYWEITSTGGTTTASVYSTSAATTVNVTTGLTYGFRFNSSTGALDYTTNGSSFTSLATSLTSGPYFVYISTAASTTASFNGGQRPFTYTPPSGFVALNTYNLPASTVPNGAAYMAATLYTGTGASLAVANTVGSASFQPDWVWIKSRSAATAHKLTDVVRGVTKGLVSNTTAAETTDTQGLTAFDSTGFTVGTNTDYNTSAATYVAWSWKAGGTAVSNTNGSITSSVSANTTSGCSVVTWTGNATGGATIGHGLGVAPSFVISKRRDAADDWSCYHVSLGGTKYIDLNSAAAPGTSIVVWNNTNPSSTVVTLGTSNRVNGSGGTYVAYCFTPIKGFSAFGSYTGNGSTDGPFVYTGFRPRWVMIKRTDSTSDWYIWDTSRDTYNVEAATLLADTAGAETSATSIDGLSNGFKCRSATVVNASAGTYIYMAFAESPFQNSLAR
jgi:hypothetical protein